jgi:hypothetical protein
MAPLGVARAAREAGIGQRRCQTGPEYTGRQSPLWGRIFLRKTLLRP